MVYQSSRIRVGMKTPTSDVFRISSLLVLRRRGLPISITVSWNTHSLSDRRRRSRTGFLKSYLVSSTVIVLCLFSKIVNFIISFFIHLNCVNALRLSLLFPNTDKN